MKKILSTILIFALLFSVCATSGALSLTIKEEDIITSGDLKYVILEDGTASVVALNNENLTHLTIPSTIDEYPVSEIGWEAFRNNRNLESVTIEEGIHTIGYRAFQGCTNLLYIDLPHSLRQFGANAFMDTAAYNSKENRDGYVRYIDNFLIHSTDNTLARPATEYTVKEGTIGIAACAFQNHTALETVNFPDSLISIDDSAFDRCTSLTKADLPKNLEHLGWGAFNGCALKEVVIPEKITKIDSYTFRGNAFSSINLHEGITYMGWDAFASCENLTEVTIPQSVTELSDSLFLYCDSLETINLHDNLTSVGYSVVYGTAFYNNPDNWTEGCLYIGDYLMATDHALKGAVEVKEGTRLMAKNAFYNNAGITAVHLPESLELIDNQAFDGCENLAYVNIPEGVSVIGGHAFYGCTSLENIYIPESVTGIGYQAFTDCTNLKTITIANPETEFGEKAVGYYPVYDMAGDLIDYYATTDEITIRGLSGSTAEIYATENGLNFEEIRIPTVIGDTDGDGTITIKDATCIQKALANLIPLLREQKSFADADSDGKITIKDATAIQKTVAKLS